MISLHLRLGSLLQRGQHVELEAAARELLGHNMEDSTAWTYLCHALLGQQKLAAAEEAARRVQATEPESDSGSYLLALVLLERNQPKEALLAAREAIRQDPQDSVNYAIAARSLNQLSRYPEAEKMAGAGLAENGGCDSCLFQLSQAQSMLGRHDEADEVTRTLLADDPEDASNHSARGFHLLLAGDPVAARGHFLEALRLRPNSSDARDGLAQSLTNRNPLFRLVLKFSVLCDRWGWKALVVVIGGFMLLLELPKRTKGIPWASIPVSVLLAAGALFMVLVICHRSFSTLMLLAHRETRFVVSRDERRAALWCLPLLGMTGVTFFFWFYAASRTGALTRFPGQLFVWPLLTTLVWEIFDAIRPWVRRRLAWITGFAVAAMMTTSVLSILLGRSFGKDLAAVLLEKPASTKELRRAKLQEVLAPNLKFFERIRLLEMSVILLCAFSENVRQFLERRAPDPE
ncbi:MAG: CDC27 family protein [Verrucomicrobiota bacterium]